MVRLGRLAGWSPIPLSVRDARRRAPELRERLAGVPVEATPTVHDAGTAPLATVDKLTVNYGALTALKRVTLSVWGGEIVAVMGRNGSGKSTLFGQLSGLRGPDSGTVRVGGSAPHDLSGRALVRRVGLVPSDPGILLYAESVEDECAGADRDASLEPGTTQRVVEQLLADVDLHRHPRDLSEGQRLAVALGVILGPAPPLILLDEPTRGLDYVAKARLSTQLIELASAGHAIVLASHDVELVASTAQRVIVLADGDVVADGPVREVVRHSPVFAPQVAKILAPDGWLTVREVRDALGTAVEESS